MAALSKNGDVVLKVFKKIPLSEGTVVYAYKTLMSSGFVLTKDNYVRVDGTKNSTGWKRGGKTNVTKEVWREIQRECGYVEEVYS